MLNLYKADDEKIVIKDIKGGPVTIRIHLGFIAIEGPTISLMLNLESENNIKRILYLDAQNI